MSAWALSVFILVSQRRQMPGTAFTDLNDVRRATHTWMVRVAAWILSQPIQSSRDNERSTYLTGCARKRAAKIQVPSAASDALRVVREPATIAQI
jgi:hypothetical protein